MAHLHTRYGPAGAEETFQEHVEFLSGRPVADSILEVFDEYRP
jgi:hypothetical protein